MTRRSLLLALAASLAPCLASAQDVPEGVTYAASTRGTVFYWIECPNWRRLSPANLVFFATRAAALDAGYRPSTAAGCAGPPDGTPSTVLPLVARVVDVGPGLCTITEIPAADGMHYVVYDAGHWLGERCLEATREIVGASPVDLLVISHSDSDHLGDADLILRELEVRSVVTTGFARTTASWRDLRDELERVEAAGVPVRRLTEEPLTPGESVTIGDATVTFVAGWGSWTLTSGLSSAERRNVVSIVLRIEYAGSAVLYAGDTVGRRIGDPGDACKDAEMVMVGRHERNEISLSADVLIVSHHGGDNGSSACFIGAIEPSAVVFSAGHDHGHPTEPAAQRFLAAGVAPDSLFRTDRGDDENEALHWEPAGTISGCSDPRGDDDVEITIAADGAVAVRYRAAAAGCQ